MISIIVYGIIIALVTMLVTLTIVSMYLAAQEREFVKRHADDWNEYVKRMREKGRWNDVE